MGLVLYPYLLGAIIIWIISVILILKSLASKKFFVNDLIIGFIISAIIYCIIFLDYITSESAYVLGTYFVFPLCLVYVPFIIGIATRFCNNKKLKDFSKYCLVSIIISGLFIFVFQQYTFKLHEYLGIPKSF